MATSGSFTTNAVDGLALIFNWSIASQDVTNNVSTVSWNLVGSKSSGYTYAGTFNVVVNGVTVYSSATRIPVYNGTVVASGTTTIGHNSDGTKNFSASASAAIYYYTVNSSGSGTWDLTTIPRASSFTLSSSNFEIGSSIAIAISRASTAFTHKIILAFGNYSEVLSSSATASYTWATGSYLSNLANQIPNATAGVGQITVETYNGSTLIGYSSKTFTANLASTVVPTCGALSVAEANSVVSALGAGYIKGYTKLLITIGSSSGIYGSTIASYHISGDNQTFSTQSATTNALSTAGSIVVTGTVTDSRGRTASKTVVITVVDYTSPNVTSTATRKTGSATTMVVAIAGSITSLSSKNNATYTIKSKLKSTIDWTTKVSEVVISSTIINLSREVTGYIVSSSYDVQIVVTDKLSSTIISLTLPTETVLLDINKSGIGIGKYNENGVFEIAGGLQDCFFNGVSFLNTIYPVGYIYESVNSTSPTTLFGGTWVQLVDRFLIGAGSSYANGTTGGSAAHLHGAINTKNGTLEAAIGSTNSNPTNLGFHSGNNNSVTIEGQATYTVTGASFFDGGSFNHWTAIYGYTASSSTLPPYRAVYMWYRSA